jgi:hypothetical protein
VSDETPNVSDRIVNGLRFLAPKDGEPERVIKARLCSLFARSSDVVRAYLVLADSGPGSELMVLLGLRMRSEAIETILPSIADLFYREFGHGQFLDVATLSEQRETDMRTVCAPFYDAATSEANWWRQALDALGRRI